VPDFPDNSDFLAEVRKETINLPVRGKAFRFAGAPSLAEGMELMEMRRKVLAVTRGELPATTVVIDDYRALYIRLCGDQYDALVAHGIDEDELNLIGATLLNTYLYGADTGVRTWTGELQKKAPELGEAKPTGTTKTATPKASKKPSPGGPRTTRRSRSSKATSPTAASTESGSEQ
jgi:hypothetical protein